MTAFSEKLNVQSLLNRMIYKRQEEAKYKPNSSWLQSYDELIKDLLDIQAMEGVAHIYYKINPATGYIWLTGQVIEDMDKEEYRFFQAHAGDYL